MSSTPDYAGLEDEEIRKEFWKGAIPVVFMLHPNEVSTLHPPSPYYVSDYNNEFQH
jgi:hypothetical protein